MRIRFDVDACTGHGRCYAVSPEVYTPNDDGYSADPTGDVMPGLEEAARLGALNCPEEAIVIEEQG